VIPLAVTYANTTGNAAIVYMNVPSPGLCNLTSNINIAITAGSLTIQKSPLATIAQGFANTNGTIASFVGSGIAGSTSSITGLQFPAAISKTANVFIRQ